MEKRADRRGVSPLLVFAAVLLAGVLVAGVALAWQVWGTTALAARAAPGQFAGAAPSPVTAASAADERELGPSSNAKPSA